MSSGLPFHFLLPLTMLLLEAGKGEGWTGSREPGATRGQHGGLALLWLSPAIDFLKFQDETLQPVGSTEDLSSTGSS